MIMRELMIKTLLQGLILLLFPVVFSIIMWACWFLSV